MLGDPERRREAGGADRGDVDQPLAGRDGRSRSCSRGRRAAAPRSWRSARRPRAPAASRRAFGITSSRPRRAPTSPPCRPGRERSGPAITLPSTVGNTSTPLVRLRRHRQQDPLERLAAGRLEDEELALARVDREALVAGQPGDLVGAQAGAVDRRPRHVTRSPSAVCSPSARRRRARSPRPRARPSSAPAAARRRRPARACRRPGR